MRKIRDEMSPARGFLLVIEGIDAVGKKTQSHLLSGRFRLRHMKSRVLEFPEYNTPIGKEIKAFLRGKRNYPTEVAHMLFAANRWEKRHELRKLLAESRTVIANRYTESNLVYGVANGLPLEWLLNLEKGLPKSDLVVVLDAPAPLVSRRSMNKDVYEADMGLQERVRTSYRELARRFRWVVVDAAGDVETIHKRIVKVVSAEIPGLE